MKRNERAVVYTALAGLAAVNGLLLLGRDQAPAAHASAMPVPEVLGPADGLTLTGADGEVTVKAAKGRLAFGETPFKQTWTVAFVDTGRVLNPLMSAPALVEERTALGEELAAKDKEFQEKLTAKRDEGRTMDPNSPDMPQKAQEFQALMQEYREWAESARARRDALDVQHMEKSYNELVSAVDVVSERKGIDIVYRFIPPEKAFKSLDAEQALTEIRLRTALRAPKDLDITTDVLEELSLSTEEPADAQP